MDDEYDETTSTTRRRSAREEQAVTGHHGSTPAAWTAVTVALVAFCIGGIGLMIGPNWPVFVVGCVLLAVSGVIGKVMQAMGLGVR